MESSQPKDGIWVSNNSYHIKTYNSQYIVNIELEFVNNSHVNGELEYHIPFSSIGKTLFLAVYYRDQCKNAVINTTESDNIIEFDNEAASNNFSIRLIKRDKISLSLLLVNFHQNAKATILIQEKVPLFERNDNFYLTIPVVENYNRCLYPNYSILIDLLCQNEYDMKKMKLEYNRQNHTQNIKDKGRIEAFNVSFESPFILKIAKKRKSENGKITSLKKPKDIIIFLDSQLITYRKLISLILDFIRSYNGNFNIIQFGKNSNILSQKMMNKNEQTIKNAEEFLKKPSKTNKYRSFVKIYTDIFGCEYFIKNKQFGSIKMIQQLRIGNLNPLNTAVICFGSISNDSLITTKKVETYLVDPIQNFDTFSYAIKNNFEFIGPLMHDTISLQNAFDEIVQMLTIVKKDSTHNMLKENFFTIFEQLEKNDCFDDLKEFVFSNGLDKNMCLEKIGFLSEKVVLTSNDIENFLIENEMENINTNDFYENKKMMKCLKYLMIIKTFGGCLIEKCYENSMNKNVLEILKSIEKEQFISFQEEDVSNTINNQYFSLSHAINENNIKEIILDDQVSSQNLISNTSFTKAFIYDDQYCQRIEQLNEKKKENSFVFTKTNNKLNLKDEFSNKKEKINDISNSKSTQYNIIIDKIKEFVDFSPQIDRSSIGFFTTIGFAS